MAAGELLFTIGTPGFRFPQIRRNLGRFSAGVKDLSKPFHDIIADFEKTELKQFTSLGVSESGGWAPLNPEYAARKAKAFPGAPLLVREGRMRAALVGTSADSVRSVKPLELRMGVDDAKLVYPKFHGSGTYAHIESRKKIEGAPGMPRRPPIEFSEATRKRWILIIRRHLVKLARGEAPGFEGARA